MSFYIVGIGSGLVIALVSLMCITYTLKDRCDAIEKRIDRSPSSLSYEVHTGMEKLMENDALVIYDATGQFMFSDSAMLVPESRKNNFHGPKVQVSPDLYVVDSLRANEPQD